MRKVLDAKSLISEGGPSFIGGALSEEVLARSRLSRYKVEAHNGISFCMHESALRLHRIVTVSKNILEHLNLCIVYDEKRDLFQNSNSPFSPRDDT